MPGLSDLARIMKQYAVNHAWDPLRFREFQRVLSGGLYIRCWVEEDAIEGKKVFALKAFRAGRVPSAIEYKTLVDAFLVPLHFRRDDMVMDFVGQGEQRASGRVWRWPVSSAFQLQPKPSEV